MSYHLCFSLCAACLAVAAALSVWWYTTTGDSKYMKCTARVGLGILVVIAVALLGLCVLLVNLF